MCVLILLIITFAKVQEYLIYFIVYTIGILNKCLVLSLKNEIRMRNFLFEFKLINANLMFICIKRTNMNAYATANQRLITLC